MPPAKQPPPAVAYESDSDTDSEGGDSVTNVQLGLADGEIEEEDENNPLVSRIGGRAVSLIRCRCYKAGFGLTSALSIGAFTGMAAHKSHSANERGDMSSLQQCHGAAGTDLCSAGRVTIRPYTACLGLCKTFLSAQRRRKVSWQIQCS